jgi:hypothetical protein
MGNAAEWVGGVGTAGALMAAVASIAQERRARRATAERAAERERREQAEMISAWFRDGPDEHGDYMVVMNASPQPVYMAVVTFVLVQGAGPTIGEDIPENWYWARHVIGVIPSGRWRVGVEPGWRGMMRRPGAEIAFTDHRGRYWLRRALGELTEVQVEAPDYYKLSRPLGIETASSDDASGANGPSHGSA